MNITHLQPTPMEDDDNEKSSSYLPILYKIQKYSAISFAGFVGIHFTTTGIIPLFEGVNAANSSLLFARVIYQNEIIEPLLIWTSLSMHISSGIVIRMIRMKQCKEWYGSRMKALTTMSLASKTGYMLLPILTAHVLWARAIPWYLEGSSSDVDLSWIAYGIAKHSWLHRIFYTGLVAISLSHLTNGFIRLYHRLRFPRVKISLMTTTITAGMIWLTSALFVIAQSKSYISSTKFESWYNFLAPFSVS